MTASFHALLDATCRRAPHAIAVEPLDGAPVSYTALHAQAARLHAALAASGVVPGDRVCVQVGKSVAALALYLACLRAGAVFVPLNTAYTPTEIAYFLGDARPRLFVCDPDALAALAPGAVAAGVHGVHTLAADGRSGSLLDHASAAPDVAPAAADADTLAVLLYTSGTTGRSKGAMLTHANLATNAQALVEAWHFTAADVLVHALPIFHIHGLFVAGHCALLSGATMRFHARFDPVAVRDALAGATVLMGVPTFYTRLLDTPGFDAAACATVRVFISGSAPLRPETFAAFEARTGHRILERYGMSETGILASNPLDGPRVAGSVGMPLPGVDIRIADPTHRPLPPGETGAIQVRGPNVFHGYWGMPEKTAEAFTPDGWFDTGDVGVCAPDGRLALVGRAKDLVISGGYNVYPKEIETELDAWPGIAESAVFGLPHADFGEAVTAAVVLAPGATLDVPTLVAALRGRLAAYKVPRRVEVVDALPRNTMGKVQKNLLRDRFAH
ncbi:MAG: AMP-binding protein [Burkholderiales bacterium]|nr:AMP-binding protein [Burkholderiales bacterium]